MARPQRDPRIRALEEILEVQTAGYPVNEVMIMDTEGDGPAVVALVPDIELDVVPIRFSQDGEATLVTGSYTYLTFHADQMERIAWMARKACELWARLEPFEREDGTWRDGWQKLATSPREF